LSGEKFIAFRYFIRNFREFRFINLLSFLSLAGVSLVTMALVVTLSVFNGLEDFTRGLHASFNPDLRLTPMKGKAFERDTVLFEKIKQINGVQTVTEVLQDNAHVQYGEQNMVLQIKGVTPNFVDQYPIESKILQGSSVMVQQEIPFALVGLGVLQQLGIVLGNEMVALRLSYPKRTKNITHQNASDAFWIKSIRPIGVYRFFDHQYDNNTIFVPIGFAEQLFEGSGRRSALEIKVADDAQIAAVQREIAGLISSAYQIKNQDEQQASMLKAVKIERLFAFFACIFIAGIASFNIFFSLAMLVIEKKKDIAMLFALGMRPELIGRVYVWVGLLIGIFGTISGLLLGWLLCYLQARYSLVSFGVETSIIAAYPIKIIFSDFIYVGVSVLLISSLAVIIPARNAAKTAWKEIL